MNMIRKLVPLVLVFALQPAALAKKDFDGVKCGTDIAQSLIGRKMTDRKVSELENAYKPLHLRDLGADVLKNGFHTIIWQICGELFLLFGKGTHVLDAVRLPPVSDKEAPVVVSCTRDGKSVDDVLPVLRSTAAAGEPNVMQAWQVDYKKQKLVTLMPAGVVCPTK